MRKVITLLLGAASCLLLVYFFFLFMYPYGDHPGSLTIMHGALLTYAADHDGWFPNSDAGSLAALQKLYPEYCPTGKELAGVSGDVRRVVTSLRQGRGLDGSSWAYIPGFRADDDPRIAILWEKTGGLYSSGWRDFSNGHAVLFIRGDITNVPGKAWQGFLKDQEQLRKGIVAKRQPSSVSAERDRNRVKP